ncbi:MAG: rhamnogalacturonan acetylesterase [Roseburia sp.]|nr:rhamnogalacturonan acetylesterase [Roseburia sp.]MCM1098805.1 rhamnogalacturonan acetylesterase [Ruminococcus flavefaciens]
MRTIFWAGDSTVQTNDCGTYPQTGIGQVFSLFLKEGYAVENHAKNGRSTKSFIDEGRLAAIEERIGEGDFLFIQFGHNDEKKEDPTRYTDPASTFPENLERFVDAARTRGAYPLLITPLERRCFQEDGQLGEGAHGPYAAAMKETARRLEVPLVDLHAMSRELLKKAGEAGSRRYYMYFDEGVYERHPEASRDNTHLRYEGAVEYGGMIARGLKEIGGLYGAMVREEA